MAKLRILEQRRTFDVRCVHERQHQVVISLIGYRATGKTTAGSLLAERLGWQFCDTDALVQDLAGMTIQAIFEHAGEEKFRDYEAQVIADVVRRHKHVVSLGGGAILREENRQRIAVAGPVVWLTASVAEICRRLAGDPVTGSQRPSLTGKSAEDEVEDVLAVRRPIYETLADHTVDVTKRTPREIVDQVMDELSLSSQVPLD